MWTVHKTLPICDSQAFDGRPFEEYSTTATHCLISHSDLFDVLIYCDLHQRTLRKSDLK